MTASEGTPARSGALTTRLNTALQRSREALRPHAGLIAGGTLADLDAMLAEFSRRRVRIALYGEVKAGKSTLLNAIAGTVLSPVAFDPLTSLPVRITYGEETVWRLGETRVESAEDLARLMRTEDPGATEVVVETDLDLLQLGGQVDLIDTPGVGSEERFDVITGDVLRSLDAVVLVVRYPGLFTKVTRKLMDGLLSEMGKLFVVWNLDQACAELTPTERTRHTETLRANVSGAHDLFLVDARAGFDATTRRDAAAIAASGLGAFTAALGRFCSSSGRDLTAVREASKRSLHFLSGARKTLTARKTDLKNALRQAHDRLSVVQAKADATAEAERARKEELESRLERLAEGHREEAVKRAATLQQRLKSARRRWVNSANATALAEAVAAAVHDHADAGEAASRAATEALRAELDAYGTVAAVTPRPRTPIEIGDLAPEERLQQALNGNLKWVRRALWRKWYVPGLETMMGPRTKADLAAFNGWLDSSMDAARDAAVATLQARLADIASQARAEREQIEQETHLAERQSEHDQLETNLPVLSGEVEVIAQLAVEARSFL